MLFILQTLPSFRVQILLAPLRAQVSEFHKVLSKNPYVENHREVQRIKQTYGTLRIHSQLHTNTRVTCHAHRHVRSTEQ
jgi:hypothetical protein